MSYPCQCGKSFPTNRDRKDHFAFWRGVEKGHRAPKAVSA